MDELYQAFINHVVMGASRVVAWFDKKVVNETGVDGGSQFIGFLGYRFKFLQTGRIPNYALGMALGVAALAIVAIGTT
jgi:NADH:ubiquinone oxidoreductase subunit 5 (subunit L)/multisubunit Na+/H+ antiporter MnhA subunit